MKHTAPLLALVVALAGSSFAARAANEPGALGFWSNRAQGWVVETKTCETGICGNLVDFRKTRGDGYFPRDSKNPNPTERGRPLCGLMMLGGFKPSKQADGKWDDGWVYDPDDGNTYNGEAQLVDPNTIKLRGYVLIALFGKTITLTREIGTIDRCTPASTH
jgi:uncharacterized protein (DUF2147 family)